MWDDDGEWASPTPCHLEWVVCKVAEFEIEGRLDVRCPVCAKAWEVLWDPWRTERGHAIWID
jgi:hypothetical protein